MDQWAVARDGRIAFVTVDPDRASVLTATGEHVEGSPTQFDPVPVDARLKEQWRIRKQQLVPTLTYVSGGVTAGLTRPRYVEPDERPDVLPSFLHAALAMSKATGRTTGAIARAAFAIVFAASACRSATGNDTPGTEACAQTYEFGNYGCARVVAVVEAPPLPWPSAYRFVVRAVPARVSYSVGATPAVDPGFGAVPLQLTLWVQQPQAAGDTLSVWVTAKMLEDPSPPVSGVPLPVFAADSALRVVHFAPVGAVPQVDTVQLVLRRP